MGSGNTLEKIAAGAAVVVIGWIAFKIAIFCLSSAFSILWIVIEIAVFYLFGRLAIKIIRNIFNR